MKINKQAALTLALGSAVAMSLSTAPVSAADNPFAAQSMEKGYMAAEMGKGKEGKCGEGKCGGNKGAKAKEGKCGEGKCGGMKSQGDAKKADEGKTSSEKAKEGKCGEGKCGGNKGAKAKEGKCGGMK
jgi:uncharacterized low-complexity protein